MSVCAFDIDDRAFDPLDTPGFGQAPQMLAIEQRIEVIGIVEGRLDLPPVDVHAAAKASQE